MKNSVLTSWKFFHWIGWNSVLLESPLLVLEIVLNLWFYYGLWSTFLEHCYIDFDPTVNENRKGFLFTETSPTPLFAECKRQQTHTSNIYVYIESAKIWRFIFVIVQRQVPAFRSSNDLYWLIYWYISSTRLIYSKIEVFYNHLARRKFADFAWFCYGSGSLGFLSVRFRIWVMFFKAVVVIGRSLLGPFSTRPMSRYRFSLQITNSPFAFKLIWCAQNKEIREKTHRIVENFTSTKWHILRAIALRYLKRP